MISKIYKMAGVSSQIKAPVSVLSVHIDSPHLMMVIGTSNSVAK